MSKEGYIASVIVAVVVSLFGFMIWREQTSQTINRRDCEQAGGRYIQHGDRYNTGLCLRQGGLLWERS